MPPSHLLRYLPLDTGNQCEHGTHMLSWFFVAPYRNFFRLRPLWKESDEHAGHGLSASWRGTNDVHSGSYLEAGENLRVSHRFPPPNALCTIASFDDMLVREITLLFLPAESYHYRASLVFQINCRNSLPFTVSEAQPGYRCGHLARRMGDDKPSNTAQLLIDARFQIGKVHNFHFFCYVEASHFSFIASRWRAH